jgi:amidohydrolase
MIIFFTNKPKLQTMRWTKFLLLLLLPSWLFAQNETNIINTYSNAVNDSVIAWRSHFHQFPELSNREYNSGAYIAAYLKKIGLEVQYPVAKTGVVALLKGSKPGPVVALRADIDALPIVERVQLPFASKVTGEYEGKKVGVIHACGNDSHIAILLGNATVLSKMKNVLPGTVKFIFQPAEEGTPDNEEGGAPLMIKDGVMNNPKVDAIFGLHINSQTEIGKIKYKSGATMASRDWFTVKVNGKSSHGSQPWSGIDPIVIAAQIIQGFQTIVSRQEELTKAPVVITVGKINSGVRSNIIPETLTKEGTIRTLDSKMQQDVHERMKRTAEKIAEDSGANATVSIDTKTEVTYNNHELVKETLPALELAAGKDNVSTMDWTTGAEDFSFYGDKAPAFFFYLGDMPKGMDTAKAPPHHTPDFYVDVSMLTVGVKAFCQIVFQYAKMHPIKTL